MKYFTLCLAFLLCSCVDTSVPNQMLVGDTSSINIYYSHCGEEPHNFFPAWCDVYEDGSKCCVWESYDHYEEWCQWKDDWCWEYMGEW